MAQPYQVRVDADTARELAVKGATILLLDVPEGTVIGMDQQTFLAGEMFKGIKMVPPGVHVISYAAADSHGGFGPTTAFFLSARGGEVVAWRWSPTEEILLPIHDESELASLDNAVKSFHLDRNLAPYNLSAYPTWRQLSGHITKETLDRVAPIRGNINVLAEVGGIEGAQQTAAELALEEALAKGRAEGSSGSAGSPPKPLEESQKVASHAGRCYYTRLPRLIKKPGLTSSELTALNLDKSSFLEELLADKYSGSESALLGEFQFAFLAFLLGHSIEGFTQWKEFLRLLLGCEDAVLGPRGNLFTEFLQCFHAQLLHTLSPPQVGESSEDQIAPLGTPMVEELLEDSFLRRLCTGWLRWVISEGPAVPQSVREAASAVAGVLRSTVGWECGPIEDLGGASDEEEDDEDGPVVVELPEGMVLPD